YRPPEPGRVGKALSERIAKAQFDTPRQVALRDRHHAEQRRRWCGVRHIEERRIRGIEGRHTELRLLPLRDAELARNSQIELRRRVPADRGTVELRSPESIRRTLHPDGRRR